MKTEYQALGFRAGLEIHQQLEGRKLFCDCPTIIRRDKPDFVVQRRLRAAAGETGEVDIAALHEMEKDKYFLYQGYYDTTCLVELDEEPPNPVNQEALRTALQIARLLHAKFIDRMQFMRKTVIDGSNTSGFQRTALIARNGYLEVNGKKIDIPTVCLEEEACQVIERRKEYDVYNLSRLGIPLIEIATDASISSPEECKEAAAKIGMILRSLPGIKRGIGSIRQDVNVSIKGGARVEIKGFQEYKSIPKVIEHEMQRQLKLIQQGKKPKEEVRKAEPDFTTSFLRPMPGAARLYPETDIPILIPPSLREEKVELLEEKAKQMEQLGLGKDLAEAIVKHGKATFLHDMAKKYKQVKPAFVAETIVSTPKTIKKKEGLEVAPTEMQFEELFRALDEGRISKEAVYNILADLGRTVKLDIGKYATMPDAILEKELKKIIEENKELPFNALIGKAMEKLRGKAEGRKIVEMLKRLNS